MNRLELIENGFEYHYDKYNMKDVYSKSKEHEDGG